MQHIKRISTSVWIFLFLAVLLCTGVSAGGGADTLPDADLNEGPTRSIPVTGDFQLNIEFRAESAVDEKNPEHEARLELTLGEERLVVGFGGRKGAGIYYGSLKLYGADGKEKPVDETWGDTDIGKEVAGKTVRVALCRTGDTVTLQAKKSGLLSSKRITDVTVPLDGAAQSGQVCLSGHNLLLREIGWHMTQPSAGADAPFGVTLVKLIASLAVSAAVFFFVRQKLLVWLRRAARYDFSFSASVVSAACLSYGVIMILSWVSLPAADAVLRCINRVYAGVGSSLTIPLEGSLLANKIFVIAVMAVGVAILMLGASVGCDFGVAPAMLAAGMLGLASLYGWAQMIFAFTAHLVKGLISAIAILVLFLAGTSGTPSGASDVPEEDPAAPETPRETVTKVWREDGFGKEYLKVSRDGERYFDPEDGEWHRIKK